MGLGNFKRASSRPFAVVVLTNDDLVSRSAEQNARSELEQYVYVRSSSPRRIGDEDDFG